VPNQNALDRITDPLISDDLEVKPRLRGECTNTRRNFRFSRLRTQTRRWKSWDAGEVRLGSRLTGKVGLVAKFVWRVKLVAELRPGVLTETEVARIERDEQAGLADLGLRLAETKRLTAALQAEIVPAQVTAVGEQRRCCSSCGRRLARCA
jgi:hypothetical protein